MKKILQITYYNQDTKNKFISECNEKGYKVTEDKENNTLTAYAETKEEKAERLEKQFQTQFFNTCLGYVRRQVTMKDGSTKNFLTDILPLLIEGVEILTYDSNLNQSKVTVTSQFINECKQQLLRDFYGE